MIHVAFEENRRAITMIWLMTLFPGNLHFARTNAAQQQTKRLQIQITIVIKKLLKIYLDSGTCHELAASVHKALEGTRTAPQQAS